MYSEAWRKHFRYPTFRQGQEEAMVSIAKHLDEGREFIVGEFPTGIGKSDMAMALAQCSEKSFIVTSQNILIDQYMRDFGTLPINKFYNVKGKVNYPCEAGFENCHIGHKQKCDRAKQQANSNCTYKKERNRTIAAQVALINTTYYAIAARNQELWTPRSLGVIDEAHNLAEEIMNLTEFKVEEWRLNKLNLNIRIPDFKIEDPKFPLSVSKKQFYTWVITLRDEIKDLFDRITALGDKAFFSPQDLEDLEDLFARMNVFLASSSKGVDWIIDREENKTKTGKVYRNIIARPLHTAYFAKEMLFTQASQFLLQSATIVDFKRYAADLGISGNSVGLRKPSPFSVENRLVYAMNTADMSYKSIDASLPLIAKQVEAILAARPDKKGIIHTSSYKVQKYLEENIWDPRLLFPPPGERKAAIEMHIKSSDPTVLVSPSMTEGIDGKGDLVRFQIICKLPYPSLADRRIKVLADRDPGWYSYQTLKTIIQAVGRGCRSEDDWCETFVLDSGFDRFMGRANAGDFAKTIRDSAAGIKRL